MPTPSPSDSPQASPATSVAPTPRDAIESALSGTPEAASDGFETLESVTAQDLHVGDVLRVETQEGVCEFEISGFSRPGFVTFNLLRSIESLPFETKGGRISFMAGEEFIWMPLGPVSGSTFSAERFGRHFISGKTLRLGAVSKILIKRTEKN